MNAAGEGGYTARWNRVRRAFHRHNSCRAGEPRHFTTAEVEVFWSQVASGHYHEANERFHATHGQRYAISIPHLGLQPRQRLLNLWSRQGGAIPHLRRAEPNLHTVHCELSKLMVAQTQATYPEEALVRGDLTRLPFQDACFDGVLCLEALEHSPTPEALVAEVLRVLRPGARAAFTFPGSLTEPHLWVADHLLGNHGEGPHCFPSRPQMHRWLQNAGFHLLLQRATLFVPVELGPLHRLDALAQRLLQWRPACELGLRQLYVAQRPAPAA